MTKKDKFEEAKIKIVMKLRGMSRTAAESHVLGRTANGAVLSEVSKGGDVVFSIPRRDFELGYFKVLGEGGIEDTTGDPEHATPL